MLDQKEKALLQLQTHHERTQAALNRLVLQTRVFDVVQLLLSVAVVHQIFLFSKRKLKDRLGLGLRISLDLLLIGTRVLGSHLIVLFLA